MKWRQVVVAFALGAVVGALVCAWAEAGRDWHPHLGDVPTWILVASASWAGWAAFRQLQLQAEELKSVSAHQQRTDQLIALQLGAALATEVGQVTFNQVTVPFQDGRSMNVGLVTNGSSIEVTEVELVGTAAGAERHLTVPNLIGVYDTNGTLSRPASIVLKPGEYTWFALDANSQPSDWLARFTDPEGQRWQASHDSAPKRVPKN